MAQAWRIGIMIWVGFLGLILAGCYNPMQTEEISALEALPGVDQSLKIAALENSKVGDLDDPAIMAKYARAEILVLDPWQFWENRLDLNKIRAVRPDIKILAYFRPKALRADWAQPPAPGTERYSYDLFNVGIDYLSYTTTGDTVQDWPGTYYYDMTIPEARHRMLDVFLHYQNTSTNFVDGVYYDYFSYDLWMPSFLTTMDGDPDIDQDGVIHWQDADELQAFQDAQVAWINEVRAALGESFIQVANGDRALSDSTFAALLDGMFYEIFPEVGFGGSTARFKEALNLDRPNNLFAAKHWPRTVNGGPWLILSHAANVGSFYDEDGILRNINTGDLIRGVALLTDGTNVHYDGSGTKTTGVPLIEVNLGKPLGGVKIEGDVYTRDFEHGGIELVMGTGAYPFPYTFRITKHETPIQIVDFPYMFP